MLISKLFSYTLSIVKEEKHAKNSGLIGIPINLSWQSSIIDRAMERWKTRFSLPLSCKLGRYLAKSSHLCPQLNGMKANLKFTIAPSKFRKASKSKAYLPELEMHIRSRN